MPKIENKLSIINTHLLEEYKLEVANYTIESKFEALEDAPISTDTFSLYTSVSAMASSNIEGEPLEIDSYVKYKMLNIDYKKKVIEKPNDLYNAYLFAQQNDLTKKSFLKAHQIIGTHLLAKSKLGKYRKLNMLVMEHKTFRIQFEAALFEEVEYLMKKLWSDIEILIKSPLSYEEVFYFASFIHMVFVNIHPFEDGNGRSGRLLEKWFIAQKLGKKAWYLQSELNYYKNVNNYYKNLNRLGMFYQQLNYNLALPVLLMLPKTFNL